MKKGGTWKGGSSLGGRGRPIPFELLEVLPMFGQFQVEKVEEWTDEQHQQGHADQLCPGQAPVVAATVRSFESCAAHRFRRLRPDYPDQSRPTFVFFSQSSPTWS